MKNELYVGNCVEVMENKFPDESVDITVTSPPYDALRSYKGFTFDYKLILDQLYRVTKNGGVVCWNIADMTENYSESGTSFRTAIYGMDIGFNLFSTILYKKTAKGAIGSNLKYYSCFEYVFIFSKGKPKTINLICDRENVYKKAVNRTSLCRDKNGELYRKTQIAGQEFGRRTNIWEYTNGLHHTAEEHFAHHHPAIMPEKLAEDLIYSWSDKGDLVLDPMCGSGTTLKSAMITERNYVGIDISEEYVELAQRRISENKGRIKSRDEVYENDIF